MRNRVFFPQDMLELLMDIDAVELEGSELVLKRTASRYKFVEAVHIVHEATGEGDPHQLCGKVKSRRYLDELGADIQGPSMVFEDNAYDVVAGFVGLPMGAYQPPEDDPEQTEERVLAELVAGLLG